MCATVSYVSEGAMDVIHVYTQCLPSTEYSHSHLRPAGFEFAIRFERL